MGGLLLPLPIFSINFTRVFNEKKKLKEINVRKEYNYYPHLKLV